MATTNNAANVLASGWQGDAGDQQQYATLPSSMTGGVPASQYASLGTVPPEILAQFRQTLKNNPSLRIGTEGEAGMLYRADPGASAGDWQLALDPNTGQPVITKKVSSKTWGQDVAHVYDMNGNPAGVSSGDSTALGLAKFIAASAAAYGGVNALGGNAATSGSLSGLDAAAVDMGAGATNIGGTAAGASTSGMSLAEQAAFLEANAGALAPGGEIAAGYGSTWGVGADGIIGQGATMTAGGAQLANNGPVTSSPSNPTTPSTPPNTGGSNAPKDLAKTWTTGDTLKLASGLTSAAAGADGGGGGGGGGDGEVDPAVTDAFGRAMDTQGDVIDRILGNADAILPFQQESLQFGLDSARQGYADFRADRDYAVGRRNLLTQQQDRMVADAANFNTEDRREQLAGQAVADVNRAWSGALDSARRTMTRTGRSMDSGAWKGTMRQMVADKVLAQAQGANNARAQARAEGYALTDRAAGALSYAPGAATQATTGSVGAGGAGVALTGATGQSMNNMVTPAGQLAGSWAGNATSMFNAQKNKGVGSDNTASNLALAGTLLGAGAKAWNVWGG